MIDEKRVNGIIDEVCITQIMKLRQENSELKQRVAELEKPKKRRKFRAMTYLEFCRNFDDYCSSCPLVNKKCCYKDNEPCKINGKYILIEVKE